MEIAVHYFRLHINDYAQATAHLSMVEDAAYTRLLRKYYADERPLPADIERLQRLVGARSREEKAAVKTILEEFFFLDGEFFRNKRADEELAEYQSKSLKAKESANARWMRSHTERSPIEGQSQSEGNANQEPLTINQEPLTNKKEKKKRAVALDCPPDVLQSTWEAFVALRDKKRAPITEVAIRKIRQEADKANVSLNEALEICCARGWQSFVAEWYLQSKTNSTKSANAEFSSKLRNMVADEVIEIKESHAISIFPEDSVPF